MKARALLAVTLLLLSSCGTSERASLPGPATFSPTDATADTRRDATPAIPDTSVADTSAFDAPDTLLLADASDVLGEAPDCDPVKTCVGAPMPTWKLEDFQPKSAGFKKTYGLEGFKGKVTVVALLSGW